MKRSCLPVLLCASLLCAVPGDPPQATPNADGAVSASRPSEGSLPAAQPVSATAKRTQVHLPAHIGSSASLLVKVERGDVAGAASGSFIPAGIASLSKLSSVRRPS